jgi:hypothetical protein
VVAPAIPGVLGVTGGDVEPLSVKDAAECILRRIRSPASSDEPVGVLLPGSDGIVGIYCGGTLGEAGRSSD